MRANGFFLNTRHMKTHAIHWKSSVNGTTGTGTTLFEKEAAERMATELDEKYPDIDHEAVLPPPPVAEPAPSDPPSPQAVEGSNALPPPESTP